MDSSDMAAYMKDRRDRRRQAMRDLLGGKCVRCDETEKLDFDHIDPDSKVMNVSSAKALDGPMEKLIAETLKCQLLCKPHHVKKSRENGELGGGWNRIENPWHGSSVMYMKHACRCPECRLWKKQYREKLVDAQGRPRH